MLTLPLHLSVNLDEHLEVPGHHVRQRVAIGLHLLQLVVDELNLALSLVLPIFCLKLIQFFNQYLQLLNSFLSVLFDVRPLFESGEEVPPDQVRPDRHESKDILVSRRVVDVIEAGGPA